MASVNRVILIGNLGRTPEVRYSPDGAAVCNVSIATTSKWKDKNTGDRQEETEWHRVVFYNRLAEIVGEYFRKGSAIYVEGRLRTRKWQDRQTGQDRTTTEIIGEQMQMLDRRSDATPDAQRPTSTTNAAAGASADSDIPFAPHGARRTCLCL